MGELAVSRAIGDSAFKDKNCKLVIPDPYVQDIRLVEGDEAHIVVACDGLFDVMDNHTLAEWVLAKSKEKDYSVGAMVFDLVTHAIEGLKSRDNVSIIIAELKWS